MRTTHQVPAVYRRELLELLEPILDPATTFDIARLRAKDAIELLRADDLRSGYSGRFWGRVVRDGKHMIWTGAGEHAADGRPVCEYRGKRLYAAKIAWLLSRSVPVPDNMALVKLCDRSRCISPECHEQRARSDVRGRPFNVRRDASGTPLCRNGLHPLKREPRPREKVYCPTCARQDRIDIQNSRAARDAIQRYNPQGLPTRQPPLSHKDNPLPFHNGSISNPDPAPMDPYREMVLEASDWLTTHAYASGQHPDPRQEDPLPEDDARVQNARQKLLTMPIPESLARLERAEDWCFTWLPGSPTPPLWPAHVAYEGSRPPVLVVTPANTDIDDLFR
jgi:hypothetical protein